MVRRFAAQVFPYLLAFSLLMLVVGSAWHVHDHDHGVTETCVWCLAATVVAVLVLCSLLSSLAVPGLGFRLPKSHNLQTSHFWLFRASRAPPVL